MRSWKIIIEYEGKISEIVVEALTYFHANTKIEIKYPEAVICSISEIKSEKKRHNVFFCIKYIYKKMKTREWELLIRYEGETLNTKIEAVFQYDAFIEVQKKYPGCVVMKASEIKSLKLQ